MSVASVKHRLRAAQYRLPPAPYGALEGARWRLTRRRVGDVRPPAELRGPGDPVAARILVAPTNYAGQGHAWAQAIAANRDDVEAETLVYANPSSFSYPATDVLPREVAGLPRSWHQRHFDAVVARYTHVLIESGRPLFGPLYGFDVAREAHALGRAGVTVAMVWHGTDIRSPLRERRDNPYSPFWDQDKRATVSAFEARSARHRALAKRARVPQLYSTPDLMTHVPDGTWLPVVVDVDTWANIDPPPSTPPMRALHLPSNGWIKGRAAVESAVDATPPNVEIVLPDRMDPDEVPGVVAKSHVVLDQFRLHLVGVATAEAMAAGRPVVALAGDPLRSAVRVLTGGDLPVRSSPPDSIAQVLAELAADADARAALSHAAAAYARRWHDGRAAADVLATLWGI